MAEQNTKQEWEQKFDELFGDLGKFDEHEIDKITPLALRHVQIKDFIRDLLASQRHQLKEQILKKIEELQATKTNSDDWLDVLDKIKQSLTEGKKYE